MATDTQYDYKLVIEPKNSLLDLNLKEVWRYRDLLFLFVRRDFVAVYKQTVFGPIWFFIQPIFTTIIYMVVFGGIAKMSTDGIPQAVFYLAGIVSWNYFSQTLSLTSDTFLSNAGIFGKVYFPRVITPLSVVISKLLSFGVQFVLFLFVFFYYLWFTESILEPNIALLLIPILIIMTAGMAFGFGLIITALTTKYRDFKFLLSFAIQLAMYATPVIYPLSEVDNPKLRMVILANPMSSIIETFRYAFTGAGNFDLMNLGYSFLVMLIVITLGTIVFNKVEKTFMDTV